MSIKYIWNKEKKCFVLKNVLSPFVGCLLTSWDFEMADTTIVLSVSKYKVVLRHQKLIFSSIEAPVKDLTIQSMALEDDSKTAKSPMVREEDCSVDFSWRLSDIDCVQLWSLSLVDVEEVDMLHRHESCDVVESDKLFESLFVQSVAFLCCFWFLFEAHKVVVRLINKIVYLLNWYNCMSQGKLELFLLHGSSLFFCVLSFDLFVFRTLFIFLNFNLFLIRIR